MVVKSIQCQLIYFCLCVYVIQQLMHFSEMLKSQFVIFPTQAGFFSYAASQLVHKLPPNKVPKLVSPRTGCFELINWHLKDFSNAINTRPPSNSAPATLRQLRLRLRSSSQAQSRGRTVIVIVIDIVKRNAVMLVLW